VLSEKLKHLQDAFLGFAGRDGVYRRDPETSWRDGYCYMLSERAKMNPRAIAQKIFPGEKGGPAKVRNILSRVRRAVIEASREGA